MSTNNVRKVLFASLVLCVVLCSCTNNRDSLERWDKLFMVTRELVSSSLLDEELILGRPAALEYVDSSLFIYDSLGDSLFMLIDLNDENRVYRFGQKGQGSNEFLLPFAFGSLPSDTLLGVYDLYTRKLRRVNPRQIKKGVEDYSVLYEDSLGSIGLYATRFGTYLGKGFYKENMLSLSGDVMGRKYFFEYPYRDSHERGIPNYLRGMAYQGRLCFNTSLDRFVYAMGECPIFMLFSVNDSGIVKAYEWVGGYPEYKTEETEEATSAPLSADNINTFVGAYATDRYVYLLYSGQTFREVRERTFQGSVVYRLAWDGSPVDKLWLDYPSVMICVSPDNKVLYSLADKGELEIVQYPLE